MYKAAAAFAAALMLTGCGLAMEQARREKMEGLKAELAEAEGQCRQQFPLDRKTAVARARCLNEVDERIRIPNMPNSDLFRVIIATRMDLATKLEAGRLTQVEVEREFAEAVSRMVTEENRRATSTSMAQSQAQQAARGAAATVCSPVGRTVVCF